MMDEHTLLIGEQLKHMVDVIDAKLDRSELNQVHLKEMTPNKRGQVEHRLNYLEKQGEVDYPN